MRQYEQRLRRCRIRVEESGSLPNQSYSNKDPREELTMDEQTLERLKAFQKKLSRYHDVCNEIWRASNRTFDLAQYDKLRPQEKQLRQDLIEEYGALEPTITRLLGGELKLRVPNIPGSEWDIFVEALSGSFNTMKGDCLEWAEQFISKAIGKAKELLKRPQPTSPQSATKPLFTADELKRIDDKKVQLLCVELGRTWPQNPNASALLVRAILLCALRHKIGRGAGDDLSAVLGQAIAQLGLDKTTIHILENFQKMPKTLLDATYHSQQMTFTEEEVSSFIVAIVKIVQGLYP